MIRKIIRPFFRIVSNEIELVGQNNLFNRHLFSCGLSRLLDKYIFERRYDRRSGMCSLPRTTEHSRER